MSKKMRLVLAQLNLTVGDIQGNLEKHIRAANKARDDYQADVIVFPELSITGYPPEDLLLRHSFITEAEAAVKKLMREINGIHCVIGSPHSHAGHLYNACFVIYNGKQLAYYAKQHLPNYGIFDEHRYFTPGSQHAVINLGGALTGLAICEDVWRLEPTHNAAMQGAQLIICPNASPFEADKHEQRVAVLNKRAIRDRLTIAYVNQVGGQDELVFDGGSMVVDKTGHVLQCAGFFNETLLPVDIDPSNNTILSAQSFTLPSTEERIYQALVMGLRDYVNKNQAKGLVLGVSGGIDSALSLAIAVDALGKDRVHAVFMPSRYTADISMEDSIALVNALQVSSETISIEPIYKAFLDMLSPSFAGKKLDSTEENIQARCRAVILMAISNKTGKLVLTTGNRSELAVGYCTLYGDMAGGYAVLKDIPKTLVWELARYRNRIQPVIPQRTIDRPPTAELASDQKDEDSLPPYLLLDKILAAYLNRGESIEEMVAAGLPKEAVINVVKLIHNSEYKRKQAALGPHIHHKSFIKDWRYPVTNGFKG